MPHARYSNKIFKYIFNSCGKLAELRLNRFEIKLNKI